MLLTSENYYSREANEEYLSVSQYKDFMGTYGKPGCEEYALAKLDGTWVENMEDSDALMVGSYVDAHFEGTLDLFKAQHPCMFKKDGTLMAKYIKANEMINRCERDPLFMQYMSGEKQVIMTADMFGAKWKIKIDSYHPGKCIVDFKDLSELHKRVLPSRYRTFKLSCRMGLLHPGSGIPESCGDQHGGETSILYRRGV